MFIMTGSRKGGDRLGQSLRDTPTYEDFADPLEARRQKRREEREREGNARDAGGGSGSGRGRQYITSFEVSEKVSMISLIKLKNTVLVTRLLIDAVEVHNRTTEHS